MFRLIMSLVTILMIDHLDYWSWDHISRKKLVLIWVIFTFAIITASGCVCYKIARMERMWGLKRFYTIAMRALQGKILQMQILSLQWGIGYANRDSTPTYRGFNSFYGMYSGPVDYYSHDIEWVRIQGIWYFHFLYDRILFVCFGYRLLNASSMSSKSSPIASWHAFAFVTQRPGRHRRFGFCQR